MRTDEPYEAEQPKKPAHRKHYETPQLKPYGSIENLTQGTPTTGSDNTIISV